MGAVPSTPRWGSSAARPVETAEYLIATFVGDVSFPLSSDYWKKLLDLPLSLQWPPDRVQRACEALAQNNYKTRHIAKLLIHLAWCLQEAIATSGASSLVYGKAINAIVATSLPLPPQGGQRLRTGVCPFFSIEDFVICSVLTFIGSVDLLCGPSPGPEDANPFLDGEMSQESSLVILVVHRLLVNYITGCSIPLPSASYSIFSEGRKPGVIQRVRSAAANFVLLPFSFLLSSSDESTRSLLGDCSLHVLLILTHYQKCIVGNEPITDKINDTTTSNSLLKGNRYFSDNPYCKALELATDVEFDRVDTEGNAHSGPVLRLPFASLFDTLGMCLTDEVAALLLYSLLQGNPHFLEYVLVRTDLDTLLMPILEALYGAPKRTSSQIYMLLIILLILSQDSSFNASIHKVILPTVPWYKERLLHQTSLGSLMVITLTRTVQYNLSKLRYVYLHTTCLATLANMAPQVHHLSAYASQRLVSLFDMLSRKYNKLVDVCNNQMTLTEGNSIEDNKSTEMHIYTDFLRFVLEILNAILTYSLPRNPEVVYAIMHRQEIFQPFRNHPRFNELLENIYMVLDFFNSRVDEQRTDGEWSVEKVLKVIITNCRSWRGEGIKMFTQLRFTYEQESNPEEFFIPYV